MVFRFPVLIVLLLLTPGVVTAATKGCCGCHPAHYVERGSCTSCHRGDDRTDRKLIAHYRLIPARYAAFTLPGSERVAQGKKLVELFGCRRCHVVAKEGTTLAASLDLTGATSPEEIVAAIDRPAIYMPEFCFSTADRDDLVTYLLHLGREGMAKGKERPVVIHFVRKEQEREHPFVKRCGGCHKALTTTLGGVGRGAIGPNLSAIFTSFYPLQHRNGIPWTPERLEEWLKNPRKIKPMSVMPPVMLEKEELERITELLAIPR